GYLPRDVTASASLLEPLVAEYCFVSSMSVYAEATRPGLDESAPVASLGDADPDVLTAASYGALKALCERAVDGAMPGRALHVRAGLIIGPYDPTDRFAYWPRRIARGGAVLAPSPPEQPIQFIDVRDLAAWML